MMEAVETALTMVSLMPALALVGVVAHKRLSKAEAEAQAQRSWDDDTEDMKRENEDAWVSLAEEGDILVREWAVLSTTPESLLRNPMFGDFTDPKIMRIVQCVSDVRSLSQSVPDDLTADPEDSPLRESVDNLRTLLAEVKEEAKRQVEELSEGELDRLQEAEVLLRVARSEPRAEERRVAYERLSQVLSELGEGKYPVMTPEALEAAPDASEAELKATAFPWMAKKRSPDKVR